MLHSKVGLGAIAFEDGWNEGVEGEDFYDLTDIWNSLMKDGSNNDMLAIALGVVNTIGLPGTQILALLPLAPLGLLIPARIIFDDVTVNIWDLVFGLWFSYLFPWIHPLSIPVPLGLIIYLLTGPVAEAFGLDKFPILGDGTFPLPTSGSKTHFSEATDGTWTFKDLYFDLFLGWIIYKIFGKLGTAAVMLAARVLIWGATYRKADVGDVMERIKQSGTTLSYLTGYSRQEGELFISELLEALKSELELESDTGVKSKEYIKKIRSGYQGV
jgi:hypothetical protein